MPRELFGEVVHHSVSVGGRKWSSLPVSIATHALIIGTVVIGSLFSLDTLPGVPTCLPPYMAATLQVPDVPVAPSARRGTAATTASAGNPDAAPVVPPDGIRPDTGIVHEPAAADTGAVPGGLPGDGAGEILVLPERPVASSVSAGPVPVGGVIQAPRKTRDVLPAYPQVALISRTQGTVILEAVISASGKVTDVRVLRSIPLLDQAAVDAVRQWEYVATRLNGVAVPVVMTVTVTFTLQR